MPDSESQSILDLNKDIVNWKYFDAKEGEYKTVFPMCDFKDAHKLIHYVILVGWFYSPLRTSISIKDRMNKALKDAFIERVLLSSKAKNAITEDDIDFSPNSKGYLYLSNFLKFQMHKPFELLQLSMLLLEKQEKFLYEFKLDRSDEVKDIALILDQMNKFTASKLAMLPQIYDMHKIMLTEKYTLDDLMDFLEGMEDRELRQAKRNNLQPAQVSSSVSKEEEFPE